MHCVELHWDESTGHLPFLPQEEISLVCPWSQRNFSEQLSISDFAPTPKAPCLQVGPLSSPFPRFTVISCTEGIIMSRHLEPPGQGHFHCSALPGSSTPTPFIPRFCRSQGTPPYFPAMSTAARQSPKCGMSPASPSVLTAHPQGLSESTAQPMSGNQWAREQSSLCAERRFLLLSWRTKWMQEQTSMLLLQNDSWEGIRSKNEQSFISVFPGPITWFLHSFAFPTNS